MGILDNLNAAEGLDTIEVLEYSLVKQFKIFCIQNLEISADTFNVANMLNKKWGTTETLGKQNLYTLRSFDTAIKNFNYDVNPNTGVITPSGNPFQVQIGVRYGF